MAIVKRGSRPIVVDGCHYRWTVRRKPTYSQAMAWSPLTFAVERVEVLGLCPRDDSNVRPRDS